MAELKTKLIATDLDGTLFYPKEKKKMVGDKTRAFLERYHADGGKLLLVSGRTAAARNIVKNNLGFDVDIVGGNGSLIISDDKIIHEEYFDNEVARKLIDDVKRLFKIPLIILFCEKHNMVSPKHGWGFFTGFFYSLYMKHQGVYREETFRDDAIYEEELSHGKIYKIMFFFGAFKKAIERSRKANKILRSIFEHAEFSWSDQTIEVTPLGCTKSKGIEFYLDYNGLSRENIMVVGDSGNDISMFVAHHDVSFCMEHSSPSVQKHARYIIDNFSDLEKYVYPSEEK
ncbi:MAG: Cof-type HAD-IIB family hydrolase [Bacilli bacterium]|nr:Cof-type HAD-IIB family hydrolase [Bacilli bacterium]